LIPVLVKPHAIDLGDKPANLLRIFAAGALDGAALIPILERAFARGSGVGLRAASRANDPARTRSRSRADEALIAAADAIRARRDGVLMTAEEWKARDSLAIAAAVQAEREAIKAHIGADDFQPDLSIDRGDLNRGAAWGRGVGAVIDYVDSRNQSPAVDVLAKPDAIESTPSVRGGALCVKGTRFPVSHLLADTASGETLPKICERYGLVLRDARRAIEQVASWVDQKNNLVDGAAWFWIYTQFHGVWQYIKVRFVERISVEYESVDWWQVSGTLETVEYNYLPLADCPVLVIPSASELTIVSGPSNAVAAINANVTLSVVVLSDEFSGTVTYQWYGNGTLISGATSASYTFQKSSVGSYTYYVIATNDYGSKTSGTATVTIGYVPTITDQPDSVMVYVGSSYSLSVTASDPN